MVANLELILLEVNNFYAPLQSGFTRDRSTESAIYFSLFRFIFIVRVHVPFNPSNN